MLGPFCLALAFKEFNELKADEASKCQLGAASTVSSRIPRTSAPVAHFNYPAVLSRLLPPDLMAHIPIEERTGGY